MRAAVAALSMVLMGSAAMAASSVSIVSSKVRASDPMVLDVVYKVTSDQPTVKVRAVVYDKGVRSFANLRLIDKEELAFDEEFHPTEQNIGDEVPANVENRIAWRAPLNWIPKLAKAKLDVLISDDGNFKLRKVEVKDAAVYVGAPTKLEVFNALVWRYLDHAEDLQLGKDGLYRGTSTNLNQCVLIAKDEQMNGDRLPAILYCYEKMGMEPVALPYGAIKDAGFNSSVQTVVPKGQKLSGSVFVGEKAYWSVDLTTGQEEYLDSFPLAGWGDEYKTTKMLFRRIEPGTVMLLGSKPVTLSKPYYIGVFEVTQKQWELFGGRIPSACEGDTRGDTRAIINIRYEEIRGAEKGAQWPKGAEVDADSYLGKLKAKVGFAIDLPTDSQWQYACSAGTTSAFNNGGEYESDVKLLGRTESNLNDGRGGGSKLAIVGSYLPNAYGIYDVHGNAYEFCLDWHGEVNKTPATDWKGPESGGKRVIRAGCWSHHYSGCRTSARPACPSDYGGYATGFRLVRNLAD